MSGLRISAFAYSHVKRHTLLATGQLNRYQNIRNFSITNAVNMKYVQFYYNNKPNDVRAGYLVGDNVVDINKSDSSIPSTVLGILKDGCLEKVNQLKSSNPTAEPKDSITIVAPITGMDKVMCIGLNYADHCKEQNLQEPKVPMIFSKFASSVIGQNEPVKLRTEFTKKVDWEVELVLVIAKQCTNIKAANAYNYVFGYTVAQDLSARDWQKEMNGGQFLLGKAQDGFCPLGPCIVTKDEIPDPQKLNIRCSLNGVQKQSSNTGNLIHKIPDVLERISSIMTLLPGDIILTGTPGGVGMHRQPPEFLKPGDVLKSEVDGIGAFETRFEKF